MKLFAILIVVVCLAGAAWFVWDKLTTSRNERMCEELADLCADQIDEDRCEESLDDLEDLIGEAAMKKADTCVSRAKTCLEAISCIVAAGADAARDLVDGLEREFEK